VIAPQLVRQPHLQRLVRVPGSKGEQNGHGSTVGSAFDEVLEQPDQQHALARPRLSQDHQTPGGHPVGEHLADLAILARQSSSIRRPPRRVARWPTGPGVGQIRQLRPRLCQILIGSLPGDRQRVGVVDPAEGRLIVPLSLDRHRESLGSGAQIYDGSLGSVRTEASPCQQERHSAKDHPGYRRNRLLLNDSAQPHCHYGDASRRQQQPLSHALWPLADPPSAHSKSSCRVPYRREQHWAHSLQQLESPE
jgi:hypothetical protein